MVGVAQLAEHRVVIPVVAGSTPVTHPTKHAGQGRCRTWRPAVRAAGLDPAPRFHDLRHGHVAMLIAAGVPVKTIQERLGHASIVMTMDRYGHLLQTVDATLLAAVDA